PASKVYVFVQTAGGALVQSATISTLNGAGPTYGVVADFDGDGHPDLAIANVNFSSVNVAFGNGSGGFRAQLGATGVGQTPGRLAGGDFNGDGHPHLAVPSASGNKISLMINNGTGGFGVPDVLLTGSPTALVVADFNGDGKQDLAVTTSGEASVKVLLGQGASQFSAATAFPIASGSQSIAAGDL